MSAQQASIQSLVTFSNSQGIGARGTLLRLTRSTVVFEVYNPYSVVQLSEVLKELQIRRGNRTIYQGRAVVSNLVNTGLMLIVSVTLVDPWLDLTGLLHDRGGIHDEVTRFIADWETGQALRPDYRLVVGEIRSFLAELSRWLDQAEVISQQDGATPGTSYPPELADELAAPLLPKLSELFHRFEHEAGLVPDEEVIAHRSFTQRDLHPLMMRAPFVHRAFNKPLGYAGDYEMVNMMLRDPHEGPTLYSQLINTLHLSMGPAAAHRNRIDLLVERLSEVAERAAHAESTAEILDIGCGPAVEVQRFLHTHPEAGRCSMHLLDFNRETLHYTQQRIAEQQPSGGVKMRIELLHESVHSLLKQAAKGDRSEHTDRYDLVYCAGLFDYLSDKVCSRLLRLFYSWVKPGGLVLATNVHPKNTERHWMEHLLEWHLLYRDEEQMLELSPPPGQSRVYTEATGVNVFLEIRRPEQ
jgi:extracellular factor (EF) 3-hydroxypalmitic acid methyl ester biosynthesis protein